MKNEINVFEYQNARSSNTAWIGFFIPLSFLTGVLKKVDMFFSRSQNKSPSASFSAPKLNYRFPSSQ